MILSVMPFFFSISCEYTGCVALQANRDDLYFLISKDIFGKYSETEKAEFYPPTSTSEEKNIVKLMADCNFYEIDLNDDGNQEIIVQENWFSELMDNQSSGNKVRINYMRGAQDNGSWYIYEVKNDSPICVGKLETGAGYEILKSKTNGYKNIETHHHLSAFENVVDAYHYSDNQYKLTSSVLYRFEGGKPREEIERYE